MESSNPDAIDLPIPSRNVAVWTTESWQESAAGKDTENLSAYLTQAAAMTPIQLAAARAREMLRLQPGQRVVDIGCGSGVSLPDLAAAVSPGGEVTGIDHSETLLADARQLVERTGRGSEIVLQPGDAEALPFPDAGFDAAHISRVLMHLADADVALREARRVVKPGGWVVAIEPDFGGMRIDHIDPEAAERLVDRFRAGIRNPSIGLELYRRFDDAGLIEREIAWVTDIETVYGEEYIELFQGFADEAVSVGALTRERADAAVGYLSDAGPRGRYVSTCTLMIVAGRVPQTS